MPPAAVGGGRWDDPPDIARALAWRDVLVEAVKSLMVEGTDYGTIPGSKRQSLLQPGAHKLCRLFGLVIRYEVVTTVEDWTGAEHGGEPFFYYSVRGIAYRGDEIVGEGAGSCNSWESKYRWRQAERTCPSCGTAAIRKSKDGGWFCWRRLEGCGANFADGDASIEGQEVGRKPNPDPADVVNSVLKIAHKRATVGTTINATSASEFYTQDVGDDDNDNHEAPPPPNTRGTQAAADRVAQEKIQRGNPASTAPPAWKTLREMGDCFRRMKDRVGETNYKLELERWGWHTEQDVRDAITNNMPQARDKAKACYAALVSLDTTGGRS